MKQSCLHCSYCVLHAKASICLRFQKFAVSTCNVLLAFKGLCTISTTPFYGFSCLLFLIYELLNWIIFFPQSGECMHQAGTSCIHAEVRSILCSCSGLPHRWLSGHPVWDLWFAPHLWWGWGIHLFILCSMRGKLCIQNIKEVRTLNSLDLLTASSEFQRIAVTGVSGIRVASFSGTSSWAL